MKLFVFVRKPLPRVEQMDAAECREAFMHASASFKQAKGFDREIIGGYIDGVLDAWLELQ